MTINLPVYMRLWSALLLSASLVSCTSSPSNDSHSHTALSTASASPSPTKPTDVKAPPTASHSPAVSQAPTVVDQPDPDVTPPATAPSHSPEQSSSAVEAATAHPPSSQEELEEDVIKPTFLTKSPSLAHLKLGNTDKEVVHRYGLPVETYPLPGDDETIEIWEYDGMSVGLNERDKVVYIEINSGMADTGIDSLDYGMKGSQAAEALGIPGDVKTNVLSLEVTGGWLKLDLDPDTQKVISLKLLHR